MKSISLVIVIIVSLISIAMLTLIERKVIGSCQRRLGPEKSGLYGLLHPISDGVKLAIKEMSTPKNGNVSLFYISSMISLFISVFVWSILPVTREIYDINHNILLILALSSISIYGLLLSG